MPVFAQVNTYFSDSYSCFFQNIPLYNPSYISESETYKFILSHKFLSGQFKDISTTNFTASKNIYKDKNSMALRAIVGREQEGPYISLPNFGLSYGYELKVGKNLTLCSGISLGTRGVYFSTPSLSSSFVLPDGSLGLGVKYRNTFLGVSSLQVFNTGYPSFYLKRYFNSIMVSELDLNHSWKLKNQFFGSFLSSVKYEIKYALLASFNQKIDFGILVRNKGGVSVLTNINMPIKENMLVFSFAYNTNFVRPKNYYMPNSLEMVLGIILD